MVFKSAAAEAHLEQARQNFALHLQLLDEGKYLDWSLTLLFYSALQLVQSFLVETATGPADIPHGHDSRREAVMSRLPRIWRHYRQLDSVSRIARYQQDQHPDPTEAEIDWHYRWNFLPIAAEIEKRLGLKLDIDLR